MSSFEDRVLERRRNFKKGVDGVEARRDREEDAVQLRKKDREEQLAKKRAQTEDQSTPAVGATANGTGSVPLYQLPQLVATVRNPTSTAELFQATQHIRKLLSIEQNPPIQDVIDTNVVPDFIGLLQKDNEPTVQFEAAWALTNIASGTHEQTKCVVQHGAVPIIVRLLYSPDDSVREQAVWALGNIAGDSPECRDLVLEHNALEPLLQQAKQQERIVMQRNATWTLSNFCRGKPPPNLATIYPCLETLAILIHHTDVEVITDACWALSYFCDGDADRIQAVLEANVTRRIVDLLSHHSPLVQTPALRVLGNVVTGNDQQTQVVIHCNALSHLKKLLFHHKKGIRKEASWTISNITAGNKDQIAAVLQEGIVPPLVKLLAEGDFDVQKEVCWALSNATSGGTPSQIANLVQSGALRPLLEMLFKPDVKIIGVALEALNNILKSGQTCPEADGSNPYCKLIEEAGGLDKLEELQQHTSEEVYVKTVAIMHYFPVIEEGDMQVDNSNMFEAPAQGFQF